MNYLKKEIALLCLDYKRQKHLQKFFKQFQRKMKPYLYL